MSNSCNHFLSKQLREHIERRDSNGKLLPSYRRILETWNDSKNVRKMYGEHESPLGREMLEYLVEAELSGKLFNEQFYLTQAEAKRVENAIKSHDTELSTGNIGWIRRNTLVVPAAVARKSPATAKFYDTLNLVSNYERNQSSKKMEAVNSINRLVREAHILEAKLDLKEGKTGDDAIIQGRLTPGMGDAIKQIDKLQKAGQEAPTGQALLEYSSAVKTIIESDKGRLVKQFMNLMEMNKDQFKDVKADPGEYNYLIIEAASRGKQLMRDMAPVMINGLRSLRDNISIRTTGKEYSKATLELSDVVTRSTLKNLNDAIKRIETGTEHMDYLPHVELDSILKVNSKIDNLATIRSKSERINLLGDIGGDVVTLFQNMGRAPESTKGRNTLLNNHWNQNPFWVMEQYSQSAISFNKLNTIQNAYLKVMRHFGKSGVDSKFVTGMREWINDEFLLASRGLADRPDSINKVVRMLTAVETIKSMGLSVTGALRNTTSSMYFFTKVGYSQASKALYRYNAEPGLATRIGKAEEKQGFKFSDAAQELYTEGLLPERGGKKAEVTFDPMTGKFSYSYDSKTWKVLEATLDKGTAFGLTLHRISENFTRRWMFRIGYIMAESQYRSNPELASKLGEVEIERRSSNAALIGVNAAAFEYAPHAKPRLMSGFPGRINSKGEIVKNTKAMDAMGAGGQLAFQLMHYPLSFADMQWQVLKGSKRALMAGQWNAPENMYLLRYAGLYTMLSSLSVLLNSDMHVIAENDTLNKMASIRDHLEGTEAELSADNWLSTQKGSVWNDMVSGEFNRLDSQEWDQETAMEPKSKRMKRGLLSEVTGPLIGDIQYLLMVNNIMEMPDSELGKIILGYQDYANMTKDEKQVQFWNKINTEVGRWNSKILPAIKDGRGTDVFRHWLAMYPRPWVRDWRKKFGFDKPKETAQFIRRRRMRRGQKARMKDYEKHQLEAIMNNLDTLDRA